MDNFKDENESFTEKNKKLANARVQRGILISSGFIAGAALFGVLGAFIIFFTGNGEVLNLNVWTDPNGKGAQITAMVAFVGLLAYFVWESYKAKEEDWSEIIFKNIEEAISIYFEIASFLW